MIGDNSVRFNPLILEEVLQDCVSRNVMNSFHGGNRGSNPRGDAKIKKGWKHKLSGLFYFKAFKTAEISSFSSLHGSSRSITSFHLKNQTVTPFHKTIGEKSVTSKNSIFYPGISVNWKREADMRASVTSLSNSTFQQTFENCGFRKEPSEMLLHSRERSVAPVEGPTQLLGTIAWLPSRNTFTDLPSLLDALFEIITTLSELGSDSSTRHSQKRHVVRTRGNHSLTNPIFQTGSSTTCRTTSKADLEIST